VYENESKKEKREEKKMFLKLHLFNFFFKSIKRMSLFEINLVTFNIIY